MNELDDGPKIVYNHYVDYMRIDTFLILLGNVPLPLLVYFGVIYHARISLHKKNEPLGEAHAPNLISRKYWNIYVVGSEVGRMD